MPNWPGSMGGLGPIMMPSHPGPVPASAAPAPPPAQERATPAPGPGRGGASLGSLLEANLALLQQFKGNMTHFRVHDNTRLLVQFRDNILAVIKQMESMDGVMAQMPQLPVRYAADVCGGPAVVVLDRTRAVAWLGLPVRTPYSMWCLIEVALSQRSAAEGRCVRGASQSLAGT